MDEVVTYYCKSCKAKLIRENREEQYERIKSGMMDLFEKETEETISEYTKNYIGYGPNYMHKCSSCSELRKIIPDGRKRD